MQGIVVEDDAANLEAVLDPQDDEETNEEPANTEVELGEDQPPAENEGEGEAGEANCDGEDAAEEVAEEESPDADGGDAE